MLLVASTSMTLLVRPTSLRRDASCFSVADICGMTDASRLSSPVFSNSSAALRRSRVSERSFASTLAMFTSASLVEAVMLIVRLSGIVAQFFECLLDRLALALRPERGNVQLLGKLAATAVLRDGEKCADLPRRVAHHVADAVAAYDELFGGGGVFVAASLPEGSASAPSRRASFSTKGSTPPGIVSSRMAMRHSAASS